MELLGVNKYDKHNIQLIDNVKISGKILEQKLRQRDKCWKDLHLISILLTWKVVEIISSIYFPNFNSYLLKIISV